ncbi:HigA family addiction module antitoxin [soil metagenome]
MTLKQSGDYIMRMAKPSHPGPLIRTQIVDAHGLSVTDAAKVLGVTRPALSALLNGRAALSAEMALRVEKAFGVSMDTLLRMQTSYEIAETRRKAGRIRVKPFVPKAMAA